MKRIVMWLASTITIVVLLFGYHTSTNESVATVAGASSSASPPAGSAPSSSSPSSSSGGSSSSTESSGAKAYTGSVAQTRWGPVQVKIIVQNGKISKVALLQQPSGNPRDAEINNYALPILIEDTLQAQSADIDMVSGATVTSEGYVQSLQSALDQAGI